MSTGVLNVTFGRLLYGCAIRKNHKDCNVLDLYIAITHLHARLEKELEEYDIDLPLGPGPIPEDFVRDVLGDGDPDGNPARFFPLGTSEDLARRVDVATKLHHALIKISGELEGNIKTLNARREG